MLRVQMEQEFKAEPSFQNPFPRAGNFKTAEPESASEDLGKHRFRLSGRVKLCTV